MKVAFAILLITLTSCSANYHLKRSQMHLEKAKLKGAQVSVDTVFVDVVTERTLTDTLIEYRESDWLLDTITIETVKWKTKTLIDTVNHTIFQQVECKPDTLRVPVKVVTKIETGANRWWLLVAFVAGLLLVLFIKR